MNEPIFCPMCEENRDFRRETIREEYEVRGEKIALDIPRLICAACGESLIDETFGDPTLHVYSEGTDLLDSPKPRDS